MCSLIHRAHSGFRPVLKRVNRHSRYAGQIKECICESWPFWSIYLAELPAAHSFVVLCKLWLRSHGQVAVRLFFQVTHVLQSTSDRSSNQGGKSYTSRDKKVLCASCSTFLVFVFLSSPHGCIVLIFFSYFNLFGFTALPIVLFCVRV